MILFNVFVCVYLAGELRCKVKPLVNHFNSLQLYNTFDLLALLNIYISCM